MTEQDWQPIETAPKDGAEILLFASGDPWNCCVVGRWSPDDDGDDGWSVGAWECLPKQLATHWMPLPSPPKMAQAGRDE